MADSRHADHHEVQPVPWISKECEGSEAETPGQNFDHGFKGVDASEDVPGEVGSVKGCVGRRPECVAGRMDSLHCFAPRRRVAHRHECAVGQNCNHYEHVE